MKKKSNHEIAILIPCYNEETTIAKVIKDFARELPLAEIFVCDNNSSDNTALVAQESGAMVVKECKQGKANAVLRLFEEISADIYLMVDGDDTYPASQAKELIDVLINNNLDMVVGDRLSNKSYFKENKRAFHSFGNNLTKSLINRFFQANQKDILSGYRAFSKRFVKNYSTLIKGFELETDLTIFCLNYNLLTAEIPITYNDRPDNSCSKLNTYKDGFKVIKTIFNLYRFYNPLNFFTLISSLLFIVGLVLMSFPVYEYIQFQYVYKVPTLIISGTIILVSLLLFITGLILDSIMKIDRKSTILKIRETL